MARPNAAARAARLAGALVLIAAAVFGAWWYLNQSAPIAVTAATVARGTVERTVAAVTSGTVMAEREAQLAAPMLGTVARVHAPAGTPVDAGDPVLELAHEELTAQVALAEANLSAAQSRVRQVRVAAEIYEELSRTQLAQARAQRSQAEADFARVQRLQAEEAIARSQYERVQLAAVVAREALAAAEASARQNAVREEEVKAAEMMVTQMEAALDAAEAARQKAFVRAPFPGVVARLNMDVGEAVGMGLPVAHLVDPEGLYIAAPFDEVNAALIQVGQAARTSVDAYPEYEFPGEVTFIAPVVQVNPDLSRTLTVHVRVTEGAERLLPGMSADVTVVPQVKDDVLYAPAESLERDAFAYVVREGVAQRVPVEIGIGNWATREILCGLTAGDVIVTSINIQALEDGTPVRVVDQLEGTL